MGGRGSNSGLSASSLGGSGGGANLPPLVVPLASVQPQQSPVALQNQPAPPTPASLAPNAPPMGVTLSDVQQMDDTSIKIHCFDDDKIMRHNSYIKLGADAILFGDATAADVAKGKTFTSAAGVNVTGTAEPAESNNNVEAYAVTDTSPSVSFRRTDGTIKIWGYGTMTSSGGWGQQTTSLVAFEGDKYHKGAIYGSPSSTSLSLSISNGKLTGLPSGLTAISAIVTRGI